MFCHFEEACLTKVGSYSRRLRAISYGGRHPEYDCNVFWRFWQGPFGGANRGRTRIIACDVSLARRPS